MLSQQYRMHPEICAFPSRHFYGGELVPAAGVDRESRGGLFHRREALGPVVFWHVEGQEEASRSMAGSLRNYAEARVAVCLLMALREEEGGAEASALLVTSYRAQKWCLGDLLKRAHGSRGPPWDGGPGPVKCATGARAACMESDACAAREGKRERRADCPHPKGESSPLPQLTGARGARATSSSSPLCERGPAMIPVCKGPSRRQRGPVVGTRAMPGAAALWGSWPTSGASTWPSPARGSRFGSSATPPRSAPTEPGEPWCVSHCKGAHALH